MFTRNRGQKSCFDIKSFIPNEDYQELFEDLKAEVETYERRNLDITKLVELIGLMLNKLNSKCEECVHLNEAINNTTEVNINNTEDLFQQALNDSVFGNNSSAFETSDVNNGTIINENVNITNNVVDNIVTVTSEEYISPNVIVVDAAPNQQTQDPQTNFVGQTVAHAKSSGSREKDKPAHRKTVLKSQDKLAHRNMFLIGDSIAASVKFLISNKCPQGVNIVDYTRGGNVFEKADQSFKEEVREEDLAVIILGTNDLFKTSWFKIKSALDSLLIKLEKCKSVYIVQILKRFDVPRINKHITNLNTRVKHFVKTKGNVKIINNKMIKYEHINRDGIHLNNDGKNKLASKIILTIFEITEQNASDNITNSSERSSDKKIKRKRGNKTNKIQSNQSNFQQYTGFISKPNHVKPNTNNQRKLKQPSHKYEVHNNKINREKQFTFPHQNYTNTRDVSNIQMCPSCAIMQQSCAFNHNFPPLKSSYHNHTQFDSGYTHGTYPTDFTRNNMQPQQMGIIPRGSNFVGNGGPPLRPQHNHGPSSSQNQENIGPPEYSQQHNGRVFAPGGHVPYSNAVQNSVPVSSHRVDPVSHFYNRGRFLTIA